jgi:DNA-directed RNA polymerase subunit omega
MARITSEVASIKIGNKYEMILIAAVRARELKRGDARLVAKENKALVTALREIEEGKIGREYLRKVKSSKLPKKK